MKITPTQKKYLTYAGIGVGVVILIKSIMPKTSTAGSASDPTGNGSIGSIPVYTFNAETVANALYEAMRYNGSPNKPITDILKQLTPAQFGQVFIKFGKKSYNTSLGNQIALPFISLPLHNLKTWLENELSASEYNIYKLKFPQYL